MMRDHTIDRLPEPVRRMLTRAKPAQIQRLLKDIHAARPSEKEGAAA